MIVGKNIRLRAIEREDLGLLQAWRNDPDVYRYFFEREPLSMAMQNRWFDRYLQSESERIWIIEPLTTPVAVGTIGYARMDRRNCRCEVGRLLVYSPEYRGKGLATEAQYLVCSYLFGHCNMHKLYCEIFADNHASIGVYKKLGFQQEGILRQHVFRDGVYEDVLVMSLLRDEFRAMEGGSRP